MTGEWSAPGCPFRIEWDGAVLEQIRAAAQEGFFALPHGGLEIGGVLWGRHSGGRVKVAAATALDCEHALGPAFALSGNDKARLAAMLRAGRAECDPVGWYVSHARSGIALDERDRQIHGACFPLAWQVILVVRPHALEPMRAGFFFRGPDGSMQEPGDREFAIEPARQAKGKPRRDAPAPLPLPAAVKGKLERPPRSTWARWVLAASCLLVGSVAFRSDLTRVLAAHPAAPTLTAYDLNGQLQIRWVAQGDSGSLEIADGSSRTVMELNGSQLRAGSVGYVRECARVDVRLSVRETDGSAREGFVTFLGQPIAQDAGRRPGF